LPTIGARVVKAKKAYRCDWCNGHIQNGNRYLRLFGNADRYDTPYTVRYCFTCLSQLNLSEKIIQEALKKAKLTFTLDKYGYVVGEIMV
jgi:CRISPR/Cas system-associated endonuclease Cas1